MIYNPREVHGTTEFFVGSPKDGRVFVAFYLKAATLTAAGVTQAVARRAGSRVLSCVLCGSDGYGLLEHADEDDE